LIGGELRLKLKRCEGKKSDCQNRVKTVGTKHEPECLHCRRKTKIETIGLPAKDGNDSLRPKLLLF
jgi:hypothetical protein